MKEKGMGRYLIYTIAGFIILATGAVLAKHTRDVKGIMQGLPYILIGIGSGIFGGNLGTVFNIRAMKSSPELAKKKEIEEKDERNIEIRNKAKARAYDSMVIAFGALMMAFALMDVNWIVILSLVATYLFVVITNIYFISKYSKEM